MPIPGCETRCYNSNRKLFAQRFILAITPYNACIPSKLKTQVTRNNGYFIHRHTFIFRTDIPKNAFGILHPVFVKIWD